MKYSSTEQNVVSNLCFCQREGEGLNLHILPEIPGLTMINFPQRIMIQKEKMILSRKVLTEKLSHYSSNFCRIFRIARYSVNSRIFAWKKTVLYAVLYF